MDRLPWDNKRKGRSWKGGMPTEQKNTSDKIIGCKTGNQGTAKDGAGAGPTKWNGDMKKETWSKYKAGTNKRRKALNIPYMDIRLLFLL